MSSVEIKAAQRKNTRSSSHRNYWKYGIILWGLESRHKKKSIDNLLSVDSLQDTQNVQEQVDDVEIQSDCGQDVLLRRKCLHQKLSIDDDKQAEEKSAAAGEQKLETGWLQKDLQHSAENQDAEAGK